MDYGFPQFTEAKILSEYIKTDAYKMEVSLAALPGLQKPVLPALSPLSVHQWELVLINGMSNTGMLCLQVQARPPMAVTNAVSWRSEGIRYNAIITSVCVIGWHPTAGTLMHQQAAPTTLPVRAGAALCLTSMRPHHRCYVCTNHM